MEVTVHSSEGMTTSCVLRVFLIGHPPDTVKMDLVQVRQSRPARKCLKLSRREIGKAKTLLPMVVGTDNFVSFGHWADRAP